MAGQIIKRGERKYLVRWYLGEVAGKRKYASRSVEGTKKDAQRVLREIMAELDRGIVVESKGQRLDEYLDRWLDEGAAKKLRERTVRDYRGVLKRYVRPVLGNKRIDRITPLDVQAMVNGLEGKPRAARIAHAVLSGAFRQAVQWRLVPSNPCRDVALPRQVRREAKALTSEQAGKFRKALGGARLEALFLLMMGCGLRPSEALGLFWEDIDLDGGTLQVKRCLQRGGGGQETRFEAPKTAKSRREVPIPKMVALALRAHRKTQAETRLATGQGGKLDLVFTNAQGGPLDDRYVTRRHLRPALKRAGLQGEGFTLYSMRHTFATAMIGRGINPKTVADLLGHTDTRMTLTTYTHTTGQMVEEAREAVEGALFES